MNTTMTDYPAKNAYYSKVATSFDETRFKSLRGQWIDTREKLSITNALRGIPLDSSILDIPCGTGRITSHLLSLGYRVTGADISCHMIELARQHIGEHPRLEGLRTLDAEQLDLEDNSFDGIAPVRFMGHLPRDVKVRVLKEWARVASKFIVVTFYFAGSLRSLKWWLTTGQRTSRFP